MECSGPASIAELEQDLALSDESQNLPQAGASSLTSADTMSPTPATSQKQPMPGLPPSLRRPDPATARPAFAPRATYLKLAFQGSPSVETKIRWLAEVNRTFNLDRDLAEMKMAAAQTRFVYISRLRKDIAYRAVKGDFLALCLEIQDSPERPKKYPTYLLTRYPAGIDPLRAKELRGVHSARRFLQNGVPINSL